MPSHVQVILSEDVPALGEAGEVVRVKPGFARNYLVPQGKAILATDAKVREIEHLKRIVAEKVAREMKDLEKTKAEIEKLSLEVTMQAGEEGKLFGSVTTATLAELLAERGFQIDRRKISADPIKQTGEHVVPVKLRGQLVAQLKVTVHAAE